MIEILRAVTIFLGAFLLFQIEPLIGKRLLPLFGGSAAIWISALLFFQLALLGGYAWADFLERRLRPRALFLCHGAMLLAGCAMLPLGVHTPPAALGAPALQVLWVLAASVGLPFLALAATGPLVQALAARARATTPYRLYALSNLGSLLGLLSYPLLIEPRLGLGAQGRLWALGYLFFAVLCGVLLWRSRDPRQPEESLLNPEPVKPRAVLLWILLPLCSSALLSALTNDLTLNIAPIPLLWVLPLAVYLLSFIFSFESGLYRRALFLPLGALAVLAYALRFRAPPKVDLIVLEIALSLAGFFCVAMVLHGELVRLKPQARRLTVFYLCLALGSALGGGLVALLAPAVLASDLDLGAAMLCTALTVAALFWNAQPRFGTRRALRLALVLGFVLLASRLLQREREVRSAAVLVARNFYGSARVMDVSSERASDGLVRTLVHGTTEHGAQRLLPGHQREPTGYYGDASGVGLAFSLLRQHGQPLRVGIIGLGAGVLAGRCLPGDRFVFYELNPLIAQIADRYFGFLDTCPGALVVTGDARLTLQARAPEGYDLLVVDAFSGDAVPVHLLTEEAFRLYAAQMKPDGLLALHVSNQFLELSPIVAASAASLGRPAFAVNDDGDFEHGLHPSAWVLVPATRAQLKNLNPGKAHFAELPPGPVRWTDDRSSVWSALRLRMGAE